MVYRTIITMKGGVDHHFPQSSGNKGGVITRVKQVKEPRGITCRGQKKANKGAIRTRARRRVSRREVHWMREEYTDHNKQVTKENREPKIYSESLPELSESLESDEWSLSTFRVAGAVAEPRGWSKSAMRCSSCRIFSASTSSSMLFRFSPPVPVPLPVRFRFVG